MIGLGSAARVRNWRNVNLVCDGNSLFYGVGASNRATTSLPALIASTPPIGGVISVTNLGIAGQTTRQMDGLDGGSSADVDGAFVSGKQNVLVLWEGTNSICNTGRTAQQAIGDLQTYIANRQAAHPGWTVVALTTLPRQSGTYSADVTNNAVLQSYDDTLRANYRTLGIHVLVDVRQPGSPFRLPDYTDASFAAAGNIWNEGTNARIHCNDAGYALLSGYTGAAMRRLPFRNQS